MTARHLTSIAVVVPCYNEELNIDVFYTSLRSILETLHIPYQVIFIDDGSSDQTLALLNKLADQNKEVSVLALARNFGHQMALTAGLDHVEADAVITMDSDLQHPPEVIPQMLRAYESGFEVVYAIRESETFRGPVKRLTASVFYHLMQHITSLPVIPGAADYRLVSRQALLVLREMREIHRYLRGMVPWMGFPYAVVTYAPRDRHAGTTKYTLSRMTQLAKHGLFSFSTFPLTVITWLGVILSALAGIYLIYIFMITVVFPVSGVVPGWASVIVVLLIVSGIQLISLGVLSQYVGMIFEEVKDRPLYVLKQKRLQRDKDES